MFTEWKYKVSKAVLVTKDGRVFRGKSLGKIGRAEGEIVFNTSITGYQEILTDPSYKEQIITLTYPLVGNCGINAEDEESLKINCNGLIIKEESAITSNWRSQQSLNEYLEGQNIVGIQGLDTRALTRHIRDKGAMPGIISSNDCPIEELIETAKNLQGTDGKNLAEQVTCKESYDWNEGLWQLGKGFKQAGATSPFRVVAIDLGVKRNILRNLANSGCDVTVVPSTATADEILQLNPDGIFLSNGPGDPSAVTKTIETVKTLLDKNIAMFGICLGHQILSLAMGAKSYKLKFGHHGGNQPVKDLATGKIEITAQNHNYAIDPDSLPEHLHVTHINLNDNTVEGLRSDRYNLFTVQYHPEAAPGPHDSSYLFDRFITLIKGVQ